ncbi:hypothetical protein CBA19CS22_32555 [Caballeronia novacaledonica]|uniref:Uncharacterized protein n=1 Tax=Caballeronia novacaledonica TaxID=1544861 RepID=A0ACB5R3G3_9BURK|nr:hypothetical protein CBA19CS22_32555 [Caballeronia novacaledonica]
MKKGRSFGILKLRNRGTTIDSLSSFLDACKKAVIVGFLVFGFFVIVLNANAIAPYFWKWVESISHFEGFGFKFDRKNAEENVRKLENQLHQNSDGLSIDATFAFAAIARASNSTEAISGSSILWVDSNWQNNITEQTILEDMGINVYRITTSAEAIRAIPLIKPDLVISNVTREADPARPLSNCPAHYYSLPRWADDGTTLNALNDGIMRGTVKKAAGFSLAEQIATMPSEFRDLASPVSPRIVFYTGQSGEISASKCARLVTNRADVLLNSVVSILEEVHWKRLGVARASEAKRTR